MWLAYLDGQVLHKPLTAEATLPYAKLSMQLNAAPSFVFKLYKTHPLYEAARAGVMQASVRVSRDGVDMFSGRIACVEPNYITGLMTVTCEGDLARLNDTVVPPYDFSGSPAAYLSMLLDAHNAQSPFKIRRGNVTVSDSNDYIVRASESPARTLSELLDKTVKGALGGYIELRESNGANYLDWLAAPSATGDQPAEVGVNLLSLVGKTDGTKIVTAIYPVGAKSTENGVTSIVDISGLPDGSLGGGITKRGAYVVNDALYERYGWLADVRSWSDVHYPSILQTKAKAEAQALAFAESLDVNAVDLADAGYDVEHFALGQPVQVRADGAAGTSMVTAITYDLLKASGSSMRFGAAANTSSGRSAEAASSANAAANAAAWAQATATFGNKFFYRDEQDGTDGETIGRTIATGTAGDEFPALILNDSTGGVILEGDNMTLAARSSGLNTTIGIEARVPNTTNSAAVWLGVQSGNPDNSVVRFGTNGHSIAIHGDGRIEGIPGSSPATTSSLGVVQIGSGLSITDAGVLSADEQTIRPATSQTIGGVIIGSGLSWTSTGKISVAAGSGLAFGSNNALVVNVGSGWKTVSVNKNLFPSGFSTTRDVTVMKNDLLKLVYINAVYDTDGTAVNVPANSVICVINDASLRSGQTLNVGYGLRYSSAGLADWTARVYPYSSTYAGIKTPTWAFSGTSVKYQALLPYAAFGIA